MCGICGFWELKGARADEGTVRCLNRELRFRGPDDEGYYFDRGLAFGHRRLKVIDLETGKQPMTSPDGRVTLIFNGEIYNFKEIRKTLETKGRVFETQSDTESLLRLYEEKGIACLEHLEGMFAFAAYDRQKSVLHLAVDPFGKKPLYYFYDGAVFVFASELKSLVKHPAVPKAVDAESLAQYLAFEYVPAPRSILKGVRKLEGGTYLELNGNGIRIGHYRVRIGEEPAKDPADREKQMVDLLGSAIERRLVSDVPLGIFLSGGLDSSALVALIRRKAAVRPIKTFTIGFNERAFDESPHASALSRRFGTEHITEICSLDQMVREHEEVISKIDEPLADASFIPTYFLCRLARKHVTVALGGDGGDELFMGYPTFQAEKLAGLLRRMRIPAAFLRAAGAAANLVPASFGDLSAEFMAKKFFNGLPYEGNRRRQVWLGAFDEGDAGEALAPSLKHLSARCFDPLEQLAGSRGDALEEARDFYFKFYLQGDILVKVDRASMANSLEVRSPLLDDRLVATMRKIPASEHLGGWTLKSFLKKSLKGILPEETLGRKKKGFGIPIARWIRGDLKGNFLETLGKERIRKGGFFDPDRVDKILREHLSGRIDRRKQLWALYVFERWRANLLES